MDNVEKTADIFVENLLTEGAKVICDDTNTTFNESNDLPPFYDEELFKKGQKFYHKHIFAHFSAKFFGLICVLSIPSILRILIYTKMSGSDITAYKRYMATIFHLQVWYDSDFKPGSKLWRSIAEVKNLHNSASKRGCKVGLNGISQKDMALTQFGFIGFQLTRGEMLGIINATDEELRGFVHLWKVVGYLMGIEDRFNICRGSVAETKAICEKLIAKVYIPRVKEQDGNFLEMSRYLVDGLWVMTPILNLNVVMCSLDIFLSNDLKLSRHEQFKKLTFWERCLFFFVTLVHFTLRWAPFRWYHNHTKYRDLWLMKNFPFLAYYKFGYKHSHVKILGKND